MKYTVLIADDEPHARRYLKDSLMSDPAIELIGECSNGNEVLNFVKNHTPDILFLDIQMPGISGIDVAKKLKSGPVIIVFSTAYDQYAIKAFETAALDYLLKPYTAKRLKDVLARAKDFKDQTRKAEFNDRMENLFKAYSKSSQACMKSLTIKEKGLEYDVSLNDVLFLESSSVYIIIHTHSRQYLYRTTLELLVKQLPSDFVRIHRSYIVNMDHVTGHQYLNNSTFSLLMVNGKELVSSRSYKDKLGRLFTARSLNR